MLLQPRRNFFYPTFGVFAQALPTKVDALAVAFAEIALERVAVRAFQREARVPERLLGGADVGRGFIARHVVADLRELGCWLCWDLV